MEIGFVTAPHTMFEGVRKLPAAHYLWVRGRRISTHRYWELSYDTTNRVSEATIVEEFRTRLEDCVDTHLMSDVPLGALLSGGVDSTTMVAMMRSAIGKPFRTVTIGFEDEGLDETELAASSAREIGTEHHSVLFTGDSLAGYSAGALLSGGAPRAVDARRGLLPLQSVPRARAQGRHLG